MDRFRIFLAVLVLAAAILACASPIAPQPINVATGVAQTMQALASAQPATPFASPAATHTLAPTATPNLLPHSLYFLNNDNAGLLQVFRIESDGKTIRQITFEPAAVDTYDVSPKDGSIAYSSNNQLLLVDAGGAGRRMLVDGGPVDDNNRFTNGVGTPVWSPDGSAIAFSHGGLNFYVLSTGAVNKVLENQIDNSAGFPVVRELYAPSKYSPDGGKLLINIGFYEGGTFGIYSIASNTLVRFNRAEGGTVCCNAYWVPDGSGLYAASPVIGIIDSGLWYIDASSGNVTTLLPGAAPDGTYNFADAPQVGRDGQLYFFFNNLPQIPASGHTPLYMVHSNSDGLTGRAQLRPDVLDNINEILWAPDLSFAVVAFAPTPDVYQGGQAEVVYTDGRPNVVLIPFAEQMHWGP